MNRQLLLAAAFAGILWFFLPGFEFSSTEIGFQPGDPDPNHYTDTVLLGIPLSWIAWENYRNEAQQLGEAGFTGFNFLNLCIHLLAVGLPLILFRRTATFSNST